LKGWQELCCYFYETKKEREKKGIHAQHNKKKKQRTSAMVKTNTKVRKDS
jgi:hypothetical protein